MQKVFTAILLVMIANTIHAQDKEYFTINPGQKPVEEIPFPVQYTYPSFNKGFITFRDNRTGTVQMNYNCLFEEMMFLNNNGDTLAIDNAATIRQIVILADTFYFNNVFVKQVGSYGEIKLGQRNYFGVVNSRKIGALGQATSASVDSYKATTTNSDIRSLTVQEIVNLKKATQFYFGDKFNNFQLANRKSLLDLFPAKSKLIKSYLKDHAVNFSHEDDIKDLLIFLQKN